MKCVSVSCFVFFFFYFERKPAFLNLNLDVFPTILKLSQFTSEPNEYYRDAPN